VLMYLAPEQAKKVVQKLYHALADGGWLIVSPSETSHVLFAAFHTVNIPGAILYRKDPGGEGRVASREPPAPSQNAIECQVPRQHSSRETLHAKPQVPTAYREALALYQQGHYAQVADILGELCAHDDANVQALALLARACANQGGLMQAQRWCEQALAADRLNASLHYLRATILQEQGALEEAILALQRALYLDQNFVLAHLALGTLALQRGKVKESSKHFETMLALLSAHGPDEILPESEGIAAGRLREIIAAMSQKHTTR
jgi:chemotaxis protein methyltransferase CheR